jgi:tyrosinase
VVGKEVYLVSVIPPSLYRLTKSRTDWNWYLDTKEGGGSFLESPLFDPISGFGGNGRKIGVTPNPQQSAPKSAQPDHGHADSVTESLLSGFSTGGGCLLNGPFVNRTLRIGPYARMSPNNIRCLTRNFNAKIAEVSASKKTLSRILSAKTFAEFSDRISHAPPFPEHVTMNDLFNLPGDLHTIGHGGVGGEVSSVDKSR